MAVEARQVTDFKDFPGSINKGTGDYELPTLYQVDVKNRTRSWKIVVRLIKDDTKRLSGIDWNLLAESQVPIKKSYFTAGEGNVTQLPDGTIAQIYAVNGITNGKQTRNAPTYKTNGVLLGNANERNAFQQALIYARSEWLKKKDRGMVEDKSGKSKKSMGNNKNMYPMLATSWKEGSKHLVFPAYVQEKLDGNRMVSYIPYADCGWEKVVIHSRRLKEFPDMDYLKHALYDPLNELYDTENNQSLYFDGELYKKGMILQDISGLSRRGIKKPSKNTAEAPYVEYHIYDCFYPLELDTAFESRHEQLLEAFKAVKKDIIPNFGEVRKCEVLTLHPTKLVKNLKQARDIFDRIMSQGGEGIIIRNVEGEYVSHPTRRSKDLVKMKKLQTAEYECVGYTQGTKGKDRGAVIWVVKTEKGVEFNVTPKGITYEERYKLFKECESNFAKKYLGLMLTVEFVDLSKDKVPQHAKSIGFRNYE